jgi:addiction module HigA family antidote
MEMFNPPHPGEIIREDCLKPHNLSVTAAAKGLGVSRQSLSELLNGRNGISADMALRLEMAGWGTAESWLRNQVTYDLWHAKQHIDRLKVTKFRTLEPA